MAEDSGAGAASGALWALVTILLVVAVVAILYFGGFFNRGEKKEIDININKPNFQVLLHR